VLIGNGSHAKKRIIPSLDQKKINIDRIFSSKDSLSKILINKTKVKNLAYYICTPPQTHFKILNFLLLKNQNVIVEKPAVLKLNELKKIKIAISKNKKNIFIENLMYKHSRIFSKLKGYWNKNNQKISKIEINFLIPSFFKIGFRSKSKDRFIILHDIGIYPISLLNILGIKISKIKILNKITSNNKLKQLSIHLKSHELEIEINIGEKVKYNNSITLTQSNGLKVYFDKIFNGTKVDKEIIIVNGKNKKVSLIKDHDCFVKFFGLDVNYLLSLKKDNLKLLEDNILLLNKIKSKIKN
jgi:hypothetical protein